MNITVKISDDKDRITLLAVKDGREYSRWIEVNPTDLKLFRKGMEDLAK